MPSSPRCAFAPWAPAAERAPARATNDEEGLEDLTAGPPDLRIAAFVAALKADGSGADAAGDPAAFLSELLRSFPLEEILRQIGRHAPLEQGFARLQRLVFESPSLRKSVLHVVGDGSGDRETRLLALRLLPPFDLLEGGVERAMLLRLLDRLPEGELGHQLVRYVGANPTDGEASAWLARLLEWHDDPEIKADVLGALVRFTDPLAASTLKRCFEEPSGPLFQRARILGALAGSAASPGALARYPWLAEALERSIRLRPGDAFDAEQQQLVSHAVTLLARNGEGRKLSCLLESEKEISDPRGRALIAFALRWLPGSEAAATLTSLASNPQESPKVRLIALESLRGKGIPPDVREALEEYLGEPGARD